MRTPITDEVSNSYRSSLTPEMVALPVGHPLAEREAIVLADLAQEKVLRHATVPDHAVGCAAARQDLRTVEEKLEAAVRRHGLALAPRSATAHRPVADGLPYGVAFVTGVGGCVRVGRELVHSCGSVEGDIGSGGLGPDPAGDV
jgi:hypothetical protein